MRLKKEIPSVSNLATTTGLTASENKIPDHSKDQKQPSISVLKKRCSENMQQIYRRAPIPKCDFNKVVFQLY